MSFAVFGWIMTTKSVCFRLANVSDSTRYHAGWWFFQAHSMSQITGTPTMPRCACRVLDYSPARLRLLLSQEKTKSRALGWEAETIRNRRAIGCLGTSGYCQKPQPLFESPENSWMHIPCIEPGTKLLLLRRFLDISCVFSSLTCNEKPRFT